MQLLEVGLPGGQIFNYILTYVPNIWGGNIFLCIKDNIFKSLPICLLNIWGWKHIYGMCIKPNFLNSIPKFVPPIILEVETYFW